MKIAVFSYPDFFYGEAKAITALLLQYKNIVFHLRKTVGTSQVMGVLNEIPLELHPRIMVHYQYELINDFNLMGLHFPERDRHKVSLFKGGFVRSTSIHSINEFNEVEGKFNYTFLSPVFPSISKKGYAAEFDTLELLEFLNTKKNTHVYALGGIDAAKIEECFEMNFDGVGLLGFIWDEKKRDSYSVLKRMGNIYNYGKNANVLS